MKSEKLRELKKECGSKGLSFDSWANRYNKAHKLYDKFSPCVGGATEGETKRLKNTLTDLTPVEKIRLKMAPAQFKV